MLPPQFEHHWATLEPRRRLICPPIASEADTAGADALLERHAPADTGRGRGPWSRKNESSRNALEQLGTLGCSQAQGFLCSLPVSGTAIAELPRAPDVQAQAP